MILVNGLSPLGVFITVGLFYVLSGHYYGVTMPVQPMKTIGAYAIVTGVSASQVTASGLWVAFFLLLVGGTGAITVIGRLVPKSVVRGVQFSTGALLTAQGVTLVLGTSKFQEVRRAAEPFLTFDHLGPIPIGILIGVLGGVLTLLLLENRKLPGGLIVVAFGVALGLLLGDREGLASLRPGLHAPRLLPFDLPTGADFAAAFFLLTLPQIPMTLGNAVIANADLAREYFGESAGRVTCRALCISMGLANLGAFLLGGMPLCHGAGGLAAHYRFGARTAGSNLMIGTLFILLALCFGDRALHLLYLIPMAVLGVLLVFAGAQLALTVIDMKTRKDLFVVLVILGTTLASNLGAGFLTGILLAYALRSDRLKI
jgi:SulP family sulfate permease